MNKPEKGRGETRCQYRREHKGTHALKEPTLTENDGEVVWSYKNRYVAISNASASARALLFFKERLAVCVDVCGKPRGGVRHFFEPCTRTCHDEARAWRAGIEVDEGETE